MSTKVSVILPTYNTPDMYLKEAVESILNQSFKDFELIIIDDCSKKSAEAFVKNFNDSRIRFFRNNKNLGLIETLNFGFKKAQGEYIFRMDSDDISRPDRLKKQVEFLDNNPKIDVLGTAFEMFPKKRTVKYPVSDKDIKYTLRFLHNALCHPSIAIRKSAVDKFNIKYDPACKVCEDYGLWLKHIDNLTYANLDEVLLNYRWHKNNISKKKTLTQSTGAQTLMFEAQAKYFNLDCTLALESIEKFKHNKIITSCDLELINTFIFSVKGKLNGSKYEVNRVFYKNFLKKCVRDIKFIKILFSYQTDEIIKLTLGDKILIVFGL